MADNGRMKYLTEKVKATVTTDIKTALVARAEQEQRSEAAIVRRALDAYLTGGNKK